MAGVRFAPSPTGHFHVGNFRTAWVSREWARRLNLPWVVRFENIDEPRNVPGARERQLEEMERLGLRPDETHLQSDRRLRHWDVFLKFLESGLVYPCYCSRKSIREAIERASSAPHGPVVSYTGHCRPPAGLEKTNARELPSLAWRVRRDDDTGHDDFVVARTSLDLDARGVPEESTFVPAYHWACAIDDHDGDYDLLVRAWDLEEAAVQQRFVQKCLSTLEKTKKEPPAIFHASLVTSDDGTRLEKRTRRVTFDELLQAGETPQGLIEKFEKSFTGDWSAFEKGKIFGERKRTLTLQESGIPLR